MPRFPALPLAVPLRLAAPSLAGAGNCGTPTHAAAAIQVNGDAVFGNGFEPVAPTTD